MVSTTFNTTFSGRALIQFAFEARLEVEHLNLHWAHACKMHANDIRGLNMLRLFAPGGTRRALILKKNC